MVLLVNLFSGVETSIYLVCRFTGLRVGWLVGLLICLSVMFKAAGVQVALLLCGRISTNYQCAFAHCAQINHINKPHK